MALRISRHVGRELPKIAKRQASIPWPFECCDRSRHLNSDIRYFSHGPTLRQTATKAKAVPKTPPRQSGTTSLLAASGVVTLALATLELVPQKSTEPVEPPSEQIPDDELPNYRLSEVKEHGPKSERPWVTYEGKVYDITDWIPAHPGGEVILRAAGGSIEPYWNIFSIHKSQYVRDILDQYVIGHVHPDDLLAGGQAQIEDPFVSDPERDERMRFLTDKPCNAETGGEQLADSFLTPNEVFYVRNHMWVPVIESPDDYDISIELPSGDIKSYTIRELKARFKQHSVTAVLQCSGNRRKDMTDQAKKTNGLQWTVGAISCAKWEGVRLRDVLADAGLPADDPGEDAKHVQFSGLEAYGASIPITSALDPRGDVLLAFRMNDEPLPRDHGFPVRVIVPGHVAARCVKWVNKIVVSDEESSTSWQRKDYKCFGPNETKQDWDKYKSIQHMPITSAITRTRLKPQLQAIPQQSRAFSSSRYQLDAGPQTTPGAENGDQQLVEIEGYAYSGGGHEIQRVDISLDDGKTWDQARLCQEDAKHERGSKSWCWKRWRYEGPLPDSASDTTAGKDKKTTILVKATDDAYNTQPETQKSIYNLRGNLATAWHRVEYAYGQSKDKASGQGKKE